MRLIESPPCRNNRTEKFKVWVANSRSFHHRLMAHFLRKRGWVVFYLEEQARKCGPGLDCWLALYQASEKRENERPD